MEDAFRFGLGIVLALGTPALAYILIQAAMRTFGGTRRRDEASAEDIGALRAEIDDLRGLPPRIAELEERLDFAERLLAQRDVAPLTRGRDD